MKRKALLVLMLVAAVQALMAIPARRDIVKEVVQPDGSVLKVKLIGDEFANAYVSTDNFPLIKNENGQYCFAIVDDAGLAKASNVVARNVELRTAEEANFVASIDANEVGSALLSQRLQQCRRAEAMENQSSGIGRFNELFPHMGDVNSLVLLVEYSDIKFTVSSPNDYFNDFLNEEGFSKHNATGSVRDYFVAQSYGKFRPTYDVYGPVTLPKNRAYYGQNSYLGGDMRVGEMVNDACSLLDDEIDFSKYDTDLDGYVDNVYVIYAGQGEATYGPAESVWPQQWDMGGALGYLPKYDDVMIYTYGCGNEYDYNAPVGIGTFCHEFSHVIGLSDLYCTDTYGSSKGLTPGEYDIMDYGPYNNNSRTPAGYSVYERNAMEWIEPKVINRQQISVALRNIEDYEDGCIVLTEDPNEFFIIENRQQTGWDKYIPGHGMLVWHIDFDELIWKRNEVNNDMGHMCVDLEEANNNPDSNNMQLMKGYPFPGTQNVTSFTDDTKPGMRTWSNKRLATPLENIREEDGVIYFDVCGGVFVMLPPVVEATDVKSGEFKLSWTPVDRAMSYVVNVYTKDAEGTHIGVAGCIDFETEDTSVTISRLDAETVYYATVSAKNGIIVSEPSEELAVTTGEFDFKYAITKVLPATNVTSNSFTANWQALENAVDYKLTVWGETKNEELLYTTGFGSESNLEFPEWVYSSSETLYGSASQGYFGESSPSLKLSKNDEYLEFSFENPIVGLKFWVRNAGGSKTNFISIGASPVYTLDPYEELEWNVFYTHDDISKASSGEVIELSGEQIPAETHKIRIVYGKKASGNLALDDLVVTVGGSTFMPLEACDNISVGNVTSYNVANLNDDVMSCRYAVTAVNAAGEESLLSDVMNVSLDNLGGVSDAVADVNISLRSNGEQLEILADAGLKISVSDLSGRVVASALTDGNGYCKLELAAGFYIVKIGNNTIKTIIR